MSRSPARSSRTPSTSGSAPAGQSAEPVEVRLIGSDAAVRALVEALGGAAQCGPASYRTTRDGTGTRAYLAIVVPTTRPGG